MIWLLIALCLTGLVLIIGVVSMAIGGKFDKKFSSKLMTMRVFFQAVAVLLLFIIYFYKVNP
ncbi:MAG: twin transmembrane helix small protein [Rickettsia endosymbiont of Graphium doson]|uniref:twin transmembrane helix small protein n=1 Tax=unclassified Rickettsia TaxID=114295 RepID=UPI001D83D5AB|nr:twin transmembrane helix small protein [Rickettsia endosymbiont of Graphium doson]HJD67331.1 twin transmembrane helix small protein [Rickettsia endosymbiont of Bembidion lapponicum]